MLPRSLRLGRVGFENIRGLSRRNTPHFSISYGPSQEYGGSAVIVPKIVLKSAVARHLLKRRVRAVLRPFSRTDHALVVTARSGAGDLPFAEVERELSDVLRDILA